jgi:hypothetical protein
MFVRKKTSRGGGVVHQLVATSRVGGRVRQRVVAHLGAFDSLEAAIAACETRLKKERDCLAGSNEKGAKIRQHLLRIGWETVPEDYQEIRQIARYHWDMKPLRNALWYGQRALKRIPPLEKRLERLLRAREECSACIRHSGETSAGTTSAGIKTVVPDQITPSRQLQALQMGDCR